MSNEKIIEQLEHQRTQHKDAVAYAEEIRKLRGNALFRKIIMEDFSTKSAARYVQESADPHLSAEQRADALAMAQAPGHLKRWFAVTLQMADVAERSIADIEAEIETLRAEPDSE